MKAEPKKVYRPRDINPQPSKGEYRRLLGLLADFLDLEYRIFSIEERRDGLSPAAPEREQLGVLKNHFSAEREKIRMAIKGIDPSFIFLGYP